MKKISISAFIFSFLLFFPSSQLNAVSLSDVCQGREGMQSSGNQQLCQDLLNQANNPQPSTPSYSPPSYFYFPTTYNCPANSSLTITNSCKCNSGYTASPLGNSCISHTQSCQLTHGINSFGDASYCYCDNGYAFDGQKQCIIKDTSPPSDITDLKAVSKNKEITLIWSQSLDNKGVKDYVVAYDTKPISSSGYANIDLAPNAKHVTSTSVAINGLQNNITYYFYVIAIDTSGNVSQHWSNVVLAIPKDDIKPPKVTGVTYKKQSNKLNFQWDASVDNEGISSYIVYWSKKIDDVLMRNTSAVRSSVNSNKFTLKNYSSKKKYFISIFSVDSSGNISEAADVITVPIK